jgi:hypothetical protein
VCACDVDGQLQSPAAIRRASVHGEGTDEIYDVPDDKQTTGAVCGSSVVR